MLEYPTSPKTDKEKAILIKEHGFFLRNTQVYAGKE